MTVAARENTLSVIPATQVAAAVIARLQSEAFEKPWSQNDVRALLCGPGALGFLAHWNGVAAGYLLARNTGEEAELLSIGVSVSHRRLGIGLELLQCLQLALTEDGVAKLFLEVDAKNGAAAKLYFRENFRKIGTRKLYYKSANGKRSDAWVLRKTLSVVEQRPATDRLRADAQSSQGSQ